MVHVHDDAKIAGSAQAFLDDAPLPMNVFVIFGATDRTRQVRRHGQDRLGVAVRDLRQQLQGVAHQIFLSQPQVGVGSNRRAIRDILVCDPLLNIPDGLSINAILLGDQRLGRRDRRTSRTSSWVSFLR